MSWSRLADWWLNEVTSDSAYESVVTPLLVEVLESIRGRTYADLGSGEGRVARALIAEGASVFGVELNEKLAKKSGMSVVGDMTEAPLRSGVLDGAYAVLVLEHLSDHRAFFREASRLVKTGGVLAIVSNHPVWTAPDSTPILDADDETLWRPGAYFSEGETEVEVDGGIVVFHHRPISVLLDAAADAGWSLEKMIEVPHHQIADQGGIPRLLACRWRLLP